MLEDRPVSRVVTLVGVALTCLICTAASAAGFVPEDIEVCSSRANVLDPEFDSQSQLMTFWDSRARVRVTSLLDDGTIGPAGCAGTVVDLGIWGWPGNTGGYNGPEWARSQRGLEIFYVKPLADGTTPALARAWANGGGWQSESLAAGERRATILASQDSTDAQARILYLYRPPALQKSLPMWRESTQPESESTFPGSFTRATGAVPRWIPGQRAISSSQVDGDGVRQAVRYFVDTRAIEMLTNDAGNKDEIWIWSAPEFGGDLLLSAVVDGRCLRVYRQTGSAWNQINSICAADFSNLTSIFSPEPRVFKGRSYVALQVGNHLKDPASQIWIAAINPNTPLLRQISDPNISAVRTEPEWFVTPQGAFVFYTQASAKGNSLRRAKTGLQ